MAIDFATLPAPEVVETLDFETIFAEMLADLRARHPEFSALVESDPAYKILEVAAYREMLLRQRVNDAARRRFLAFAGGADLEHLAAFYGVERLVITPANDSAFPPVAAVYEADDHLRGRVRDHLAGSSSAGPAAWYRFHAMAADPGVLDVGVDAPSGGNVRVAVLGRTANGAPTAETMAAVEAAIMAPDVRALCHTITVQPAAIIPVNVTAAITLLPSAPLSAVQEIEATLRAAFDASRGLGWDVTRSWISKTLHTAAVYKVELAGPAADVTVAPHQAPALGQVTLTFAGRAG